ncbi:hypothetical protein HK096_006353 [Nowakowskiella sp. JEL0078]|nr:hypothetical protein HK096_006353 [Nowakowskiella sp. JEL0078]
MDQQDQSRSSSLSERNTVRALLPPLSQTPPRTIITSSQEPHSMQLQPTQFATVTGGLSGVNRSSPMLRTPQTGFESNLRENTSLNQLQHPTHNTTQLNQNFQHISAGDILSKMHVIAENVGQITHERDSYYDSLGQVLPLLPDEFREGASSDLAAINDRLKSVEFLCNFMHNHSSGTIITPPGNHLRPKVNQSPADRMTVFSAQKSKQSNFPTIQTDRSNLGLVFGEGNNLGPNLVETPSTQSSSSISSPQLQGVGSRKQGRIDREMEDYNEQLAKRHQLD